MKISKKDALQWFEFFSELPDDEEISAEHEEIIYATFSQIEAAVDQQNDLLMSDIKNLKTIHENELLQTKLLIQEQTFLNISTNLILKKP